MVSGPSPTLPLARKLAGEGEVMAGLLLKGGALGEAAFDFGD